MKLAGYVFRRAASGAVTVATVATLCFFAIHALPGDPTEVLLDETAGPELRAALRHRLHLDLPIFQQYLVFVRESLFNGMGRSWVHQDQTAASAVLAVWPHTAALALSAMAIAWAIAIPLAVFAATRPATRTDAMVGVLSLLGMALPSLWVGPMLILLFCVALPWLPFPGPDAVGLGALVLPSITLGTGMAGILTRMGRGALREVLREPYIQTARAKGLRERTVLFKHALRTALVPLLTVGGAQLSALLGGAIVTERIFDRVGLGSLFLDALLRRDLPVVMACVVSVAITVVLVQLAVDLGYAVVDPRIRVSA